MLISLGGVGGLRVRPTSRLALHTKVPTEGNHEMRAAAYIFMPRESESSPSFFSLQHYPNKEDTYYHSRAVCAPSDPPTHYAMNVALKLHTITKTQPLRVGGTRGVGGGGCMKAQT